MRSQAWDDHPSHKITVEAHPGTVTVRAGDAVVVQSDKALILREGKYPPIFYFPMADVNAAELVATEHSTHCPFKGDARYWSLKAIENGENAVWAYDDPFDQMEEIRGHVAFYEDRVEIAT